MCGCKCAGDGVGVGVVVGVGVGVGGAERGSKPSGKVSHRTVQPSSGTVIVSRVRERNGGGGCGGVVGWWWGLTVEINEETHM